LRPVLTTQSEVAQTTTTGEPAAEPTLTVLVPYRRGSASADQHLDRVRRALTAAGPVRIVALPYGPGADVFDIAHAHRPRPDRASLPGATSRSEALRAGLAEADSPYVAWLDVDRGVAADNLSGLVRMLELYEADAVVGSRPHPESAHTAPWRRRALARSYRRFARLVLPGSVPDMRAGVGVVRREVLHQVLPHCADAGHLAEVELLVLAEHLGYRRLVEAPVAVAASRTERIRPAAVLATVRATLALRRRLARHTDPARPVRVTLRVTSLPG
jgi:hypothetical protein